MVASQSILITGARAPVALHWARLLTAAGHRVILVDHLKYPIAAATRLNVRYCRIPPFDRNPDGAGQALKAIIAQHAVSMVIPTCEEVLHLGALWQHDRPVAALFAPDFDLLSEAHNKYRFIGLCEGMGLSVPATRLLESVDDLSGVSARAGELVFKPVWSRFGAEVLLRPKPTQLAKITPSPAKPWVAQEFVSGRELSVYAVALRGRVVALAAYEGLVRAGPGAAVCFQRADHGAVRRFVETFVLATQWTGQISFDLIVTETGVVLPLECNPRATSGLHFFSDGQAFSHAVLDDGQEVEPDIDAPLGVPLALWLYGLPMLLGRQSRKTFLHAVRRSGDVMNWPGDRIGLYAQGRSFAELAAIALRQRISLRQASTWGIAWDGPDQSSIS